MRFLRRRFSVGLAPVPPVDFTLPDDSGRLFTYDAEYRRRRNSVLVWYRGHW